MREFFNKWIFYVLSTRKKYIIVDLNPVSKLVLFTIEISGVYDLRKVYTRRRNFQCRSVRIC